MSNNLRTFKRLSSAKAAAQGKPILRIGMSLYVVGCDDMGMTEVCVISPNGSIAGHVLMKHLNRLGNANHATGHPNWPSPEFLYGNADTKGVCK